MIPSLFPVILAGGSGTRLWPLSRKNYPKQFLCLQGEATLLQQTMQRVEALRCQQALLVSNEAHYFLCQEQLQTSPLAITYLLEPLPRNTAPAIAVAANHLIKTVGKDAMMLVLPSDHWIGDLHIWEKTVQEALDIIKDHSLITTFGIQASSPKTGYGYIAKGSPISSSGFRISHFHEKPQEHIAKSLIHQGNYLWNSGIYVVKAKFYLEELAKYAPSIANYSQKAYEQALHHQDFIRINKENFALCDNLSIDCAVMEHTDKAAVVESHMPWSDLGCWTSVLDIHPTDENGNALQGNVVAKDSNNSLIYSEKPLVTALGIQEHIIVATSDAVLVADKRYAQQVKDMVAEIKNSHSPLLNDHARILCPWGYFEILAEGEAFKVKRLMVKPGAKLSLQLHQHRTEHWVVVQGCAEVINGDAHLYLQVNQSTYIEKNTKHRLGNPTSDPLFVIEVQSGNYLGEDDIQRFDDLYPREILQYE